jgi:hypothetical protein
MAPWTECGKAGRNGLVFLSGFSVNETFKFCGRAARDRTMCRASNRKKLDKCQNPKHDQLSPEKNLSFKETNGGSF